MKITYILQQWQIATKEDWWQENMTDKVYIITLNKLKVASSRIADIPKFKKKKTQVKLEFIVWAFDADGYCFCEERCISLKRKNKQKLKIYEKLMKQRIKHQQQSLTLFNQWTKRTNLIEAKKKLQKVHLDNSTSIQFKCKLLKNGERARAEKRHQPLK